MHTLLGNVFLQAMLAVALAAEPATGNVLVLPVKAAGDMSQVVLPRVEELVVRALRKHAPGLQVLTRDDVDTLPNHEHFRQLLECTQVSCVGKLGGEFNVQAVLATRVGQVGEQYVLSLVWMDVASASVTMRRSEELGPNSTGFANGVMRAMTALSSEMSQGKGETKSPESAESTHKACEGHDAAACYREALQQQEDTSIEKEARAARVARLLKLACAGGEGRACVHLALNQVWSGAPESAETARLYETACTHGNAVGCLNLGMAYERGKGVAVAPEQALHFYEQACKHGELQGCSFAGHLLSERDAPRAAVMLRLACDGAEASACRWLGDLYEAGRGVKQDMDVAHTLHRKACAAGDTSSCAQSQAVSEDAN